MLSVWLQLVARCKESHFFLSGLLQPAVCVWILFAQFLAMPTQPEFGGQNGENWLPTDCLTSNQMMPLFPPRSKKGKTQDAEYGFTVV